MLVVLLETTTTIDELREQLLSRSFLYADPVSYSAGVEDVLAALDVVPEASRAS